MKIKKLLLKKLKKKLMINYLDKVVTNISLVKNYCPAEEYHQKYLEKK